MKRENYGRVTEIMKDIDRLERAKEALEYNCPDTADNVVIIKSRFTQSGIHLPGIHLPECDANHLRDVQISKYTNKIKALEKELTDL